MNIPTLCTASLIVLTCALFKANAQDFATPQAAINSYITGVTQGIGKNVEMAFQESATIQFFDQRDHFNSFNRNQFIKLIDTGNKWHAKVEITKLLKTNNVANATVEFTWGEHKQHGYVDYLNLVFDGKKWQVTSKVAQYVSRAQEK
ncbi:nuclear transport factor 2 family protein [Pseudoalteromonas luteoviolacea]|uniref:Nuclear transport factor 2 family protein n=1 Tax=Pseudoalteromonas luteoviolacea S4054 TaxID=1129367 RepID=A0A0F6A6D1_9GAMM|nr:nuclear transport factor 2 family protein [Pseudoalteromonas luteoviolacea]AOT11075.1 hypothetical protein S4054249_24895 [Pseudoalteromonas luteoviolacea]AOT15761.1 hypothetical protein S40542_23615 [Pseudoalteromonas luteoviolacea]AOT20896.1 hypothetical protein S4054_24815 [Pseudoalteromonas luteoviolacea]KKE80989.1 hypothetical protein N479_24075 [Pseudoalteromonas luteoviolacea S4054]KZN74550.1 hypothetical protein N481_09000 [Pseudoalteromonas luteoviolacea S4047-1]